MPAHLHLLGVLVVAALSRADPGRIPKVYNALITSNQNLEPSIAYPVYQPVLHDAAFPFPYSPAVYYGGFPLGGLGPAPSAAAKPKDAIGPSSQPPATDPAEKPEAAPAGPPPASPPEASANDDQKPTQPPPLPPNTESPIPLNQFGLPAQVFPLNRFNPAYDGFTKVGPFTYSYPGFRFYDPYDPFDPFIQSTYANFPALYPPLTNVLSSNVPRPSAAPTDIPDNQPRDSKPDQASPPSQPADLNVLNYSSKDPTIPNVVPPLPSAGNSDKTE